MGGHAHYIKGREQFAHRARVDAVAAVVAVARGGVIGVDEAEVGEVVVVAQLEQVGHGRSHSRGLVLLVGAGHKQHIARQLLPLCPQLAQEGDVDGHPAFHVAHTPAEEPCGLVVQFSGRGG